MSRDDFATYNDGVAYVYREKSGRLNDFNAKRNVAALADMDFIVKLDFQESSKREQDLEFASQNGFSLSLKIRTRYQPKVDNKCKVVIDDYLYAISHVDKSRREMWLYLEGVRSLVPAGD